MLATERGRVGNLGISCSNSQDKFHVINKCRELWASPLPSGYDSSLPLVRVWL